LTNLSQDKKLNAIHFETNKEVSKYILENISEGTTILFKASRFMKFEEIIKELEK
jgi:UDP-N-acetylmuramyl pentapeptide synthase